MTGTDIATRVFNETNVSPAGAPPVRIGIAGVGRTVFENHVPALRALGGMFEVIAACDTQKPHRDRLQEIYPGLRHYRRLDDMYDDPELEVVLVALPSQDHQKEVLAALSRNLWTVAETPPAMTLEGMQVLEKCSVREGSRLIVSLPMRLSPAFALARAARSDKALGEVFEIRVRATTYQRRDDWQSVMRCGGGIARFAALDPLVCALNLLDAPPRQIWSELKRVASVGDAEDHARIMLKTVTPASADITVSSAIFDADEPLFEIRGSRGVFRVMPGATEGTYTTIEPGYRLPRRRSSMSTPPLDQPEETFPTVRRTVTADDPTPGCIAMWRRLHACVRGGAEWPLPVSEVTEAVRLLQIVRQASPFHDR